MAEVGLRVELPSYSHSFVVTVPSSASVLDVKREIFRSCAGNPKVDGQRLVWRGRYLRDHEVLQDIWMRPEDIRVIHLAVNPSAWTSTPPGPPLPTPDPIPNPPLYSTNSVPPATQAGLNHTFPYSPLSSSHPLSYVLFKHQHALLVLLQSGPNLPISQTSMHLSRTHAVRCVERHGWIWPSVLDEPFPGTTPGGISYERVNINNQWFLRLRPGSQDPTPAQLHALRVLSYTLVILKLPTTASNPSTQPNPSQSVQIPAHVNLVLQQLGLPQLNVHQINAAAIPPLQVPNAGNPHPIVEVREIRMGLGPLLIPLMMLVFRTLLLLYFVSPARKPVFGVLIVAWVLYEIWQPIRNGLRRARQLPQRPVGAPVNNMAGGNMGAVAGDVVVPQNPQQPPRVVGNDLAAGIYNALGHLNIDVEDRALAESGASPPTLYQKAFIFASLLLSTVHPGVWNQRRNILGRREGRIRTENGVLENIDGENAPEEEENEAENAARVQRRQARAHLAAQHAARPAWVQEYMRRVVSGDWVDDAD